MKHIAYKLFALCLALVMLVTCFTSCATKPKDEETSATRPNDIEEPSDEYVDLGEYTLPGDDDPETSDNSSVTSTTKKDGNITTTKPSGNGNGGASTTAPSGAGNGSGNSLTQSDIVSLLKAAGYIYDPVQDIYYTDLNPWQRHFGFTGSYDTAANYFNMSYTTFKCDFTYQGKYWRIQCWKGQYALLCGAEMGVYTKDINSSLSDDFYACANDDNLLEMGFDFYKTTQDYNNGKRLFYRPLEYHWWQTGFKFGYCNSKNCVVVMTLYAKDTEMANQIENGLRAVKDANGNLNPFYKYGTNLARDKANIYKRDGNQFTIRWVTAGYENYSGDMA